jgi:hypothetical protein
MTIEVNTSEEAWLTSYLVDRLKQHLAIFEISHIQDGSNNNTKIFDKRRYYNQVHHLLKVGAFKPVPPFVINLSDLSPKILKELIGLDVQDRRLVLKQAVGRIFEDINCKLFHDSISSVLEVKLVD